MELSEVVEDVVCLHVVDASNVDRFLSHALDSAAFLTLCRQVKTETVVSILQERYDGVKDRTILLMI